MTSDKLIIFDMGNTLLNFHSGTFSDEEKDLIGLIHLNNYLKNTHNLHIPLTVLKTEFLDKWYSNFYLRKKKLIELDFNKYLWKAIKLYNSEIKEINSIEYMRAFYAQYIQDSVCTDGAKEILKYLKDKNYTIQVISNCILHDDIYIDVFKKHGLDKYIDKYIFSYSRKIRKPNLKLFKEALKDYTGKIDNVIMVGDSLTADIEPAEQLGMKGILFDKDNKVYFPRKVRKLVEVIKHID